MVFGEALCEASPCQSEVTGQAKSRFYSSIYFTKGDGYNLLCRMVGPASGESVARPEAESGGIEAG